ncbi:hypothetical protein KYE_16458 [Marinobacter manganoxydans MnI7-9]|uniref:Uncharacterized protein n=1 Tax=Marinobacter manganoxydans MnI7-9 TaxID=1094979 RepID=G6YWM8_9GAMM|nr:hypothetical protein KYE_16458 [Marinobacter manganoxydans MnI7-9]
MMRVAILMVLRALAVMIMTVAVIAFVQDVGFSQLRYSMG